jgi:hypothetical protein
MQSHRWEILTEGGEVIKGTDSMPKPGVRDATRALKLSMAHYPVELKLLIPLGADLIFFRSTEILKEFDVSGRLKKSGNIITYTLGWNLAGKKSVVVVGWTEKSIGVFRKKRVPIPYAMVVDDDGRTD